MRAPAELDDSNRGHSHRLSRCSSNFVIQSTTYFALLATIAAQHAFRLESRGAAPCIDS